nr:GNAT family N-acetyltransferase [Mammaliicoccus sp. Marseille-Q6498]
MLIRDKKDSDIESIAKVHYESWMSTYKGILPDHYLDNITLESYIEKRHIFNAPCLVAEVDDQVVGFLMYSKDKDEDTSDKCGEIMVIYLLEAYQNSGIGTELMQEAERRMSKDYDQLSVWVVEQNIQAVNFYEKFGFKKDGKSELNEQDATLRDIRMMKDI